MLLTAKPYQYLINQHVTCLALQLPLFRKMVQRVFKIRRTSLIKRLTIPYPTRQNAIMKQCRNWHYQRLCNRYVNGIRILQ